MGHKGHWGEYTGNAKWSRDHAHTRVTSKNYDDAVKDDAAHIDYLKRDIIYDAHHGHSDEKMTADEKHISKLAGDMKYDKKHHSPATHPAGSSGRKKAHEHPHEKGQKLVYTDGISMYESPTDFNPALRAAEKAGKLNESFAKVVRDDAAGKMNMGEGMPFLGKKKGQAMPDFDYEDPNYRESRQYKKFERKQKRQERRAARKEKRNAAAEMHCMGKKK